MRRKPLYIHDRPAWPKLRWNSVQLTPALSACRHQQGRLPGQMEALGFQLQQEAVLQTLTDAVVKRSEIEGETLDVRQVRSSVARRLGLDVGGIVVADRHVEGVVDMTLDATRHYDRALTADRLFAWHGSLFPTGRRGMRRIHVGSWRNDNTGPMQVVSGPIGRERVHYEGPAAGRLEEELKAFLEWFEGAGAGHDPVIKAGLAHLWFVTVHPFDDGNGRLARAIADLALARSERSAQRFYSMSSQIRQERGVYYDSLERTQRGTLDVTPWMEWFLACLTRAIDGAQTTLAAVRAKARFWQTLGTAPINERQRLMLNRLLENFEGHLTTSKWATIAKCSSDTALRDILELVGRDILMRNPGRGRSTSYSLAESQR